MPHGSTSFSEDFDVMLKRMIEVASTFEFLVSG
jgi:hypothetical protein